MAEHFSFFDAVETDGIYDREYNAQQFTDYFSTLVTTGVMKGKDNMLSVAANGSNMVTSLDTGVAFIEGRYYYNDAPLTFTHDTETLGLNRIDRIVIRLNLSTEARYVKAFIKKGTASTNPTAPVLTQNETVYEISVAQVKIVGGQTYIAANAVTDERGTDVICPWTGSNILPSFDDNALAAHINDGAIHVTQTEKDSWALKDIGNVLTANLINGWKGINGGIRYYKDGFGIVHFWGEVTGGSSDIFSFPVGYRPSIQGIFPCYVIQGNAVTGFTFQFSDLRIYTTGYSNFSVTYNTGDRYVFSGQFMASN